MEMLDVARTPSYLKGLAETRARVAAAVAEYQALADEFNGKLATAKAELAACDRLIQKFSPLLQPELIPGIRAWQGHYGKRGAFKEALIEHLRGCAPAEVSGPALRDALQAHFGLDFPSGRARERWWTHTGLKQLALLKKEGLIERVGEQGLPGTPSRWRWKTEAALGLEALAAEAHAAGVGVEQAFDIPDGAELDVKDGSP